MIQRIISFVILALFSFCIFAQHSNTMYFMDRVPQSTQLNPAFQPKSNIFIQVPGAATNLSIGNNSLSMSNLFPYNSDSDKVTSFLHPNADPMQFVNSLEDENKFFSNLQQDILAFGFRVQSLYFSYNMSLKNDVSFSYPRDFVKMSLVGWEPGSNYDFSNFGINSTTYLENAFAASKIINDEFTVGARFKVLHGIFDISTLNDKLEFTCTEIPANQENEHMYRLGVKSDVTINAYMPYFSIPSDSSGVKFSEIKTRSNPAKYLFPLSSKGIGFDLGVTYSGFDMLVLSASLLDLGFISWKNSAYNFKLNGDYSFVGVDIDIDSLEKSFESITDSITDSFTFDKTTNNYTRSLPSRMYLAAEYKPLNYLSFGLLSLSQYYRRQFYQQITASANFRPLNMLMLSFSYSFFDNGFSNMGVGLTWRTGPLQFYFISDNIPMRYGRLETGFIPYRMESFSMRTGLNFVFGSTNRRAMKDKPLLWE